MATKRKSEKVIINRLEAAVNAIVERLEKAEAFAL